MISIIIPTFNRVGYLLETLESVAKAIKNYKGDDVEVIVVDNNSTDDTAKVVQQHVEEHPEITLKFIREPRQGLSYARNTGMKNAYGSILCFIDDDVLVSENWLTEIEEAFYLDPKVGCVAGRIKLKWPGGSPPKWLSERYYAYYSGFDWGDRNLILPFGTDFYGANFALSRAAVERIGGFRTDLGRKGTNLLSGEDTEYASRLWRHGFVIAYSAKGWVWHQVPASRVKFSWLWRRCLWGGVSSYYKPKNRYLTYPLRRLPKLFGNLLLLPLALLTCRRRMIYRLCFRIADALGPFYGLYLDRN